MICAHRSPPCAQQVADRALLFCLQVSTDNNWQQAAAMRELESGARGELCGCSGCRSNSGPVSGTARAHEARRASGGVDCSGGAAGCQTCCCVPIAGAECALRGSEGRSAVPNSKFAEQGLAWRACLHTCDGPSCTTVAVTRSPPRGEHHQVLWARGWRIADFFYQSVVAHYLARQAE